MKKNILLLVCLLSVGFLAFAGDAAVFVDEGFSKDGSVYVFGQYGKTDKTFKPYSEIYTVDVAKNDFISGGIFKTSTANAATTDSGSSLYEELLSKNFLFLKKYSLKKTSADNLLYICEDEKKKGTDEIVFTDFAESTLDSPIYWHVSLVPTVSGSGKNAKSSFYISVKLQDSSVKLLKQYTAGSPDVKRTGVTGYKIERIVRDDAKKSLVFIVEKTVEDSTGTCIRYMVETLKL